MTGIPLNSISAAHFHVRAACGGAHAVRHQQKNIFLVNRKIEMTTNAARTPG